MAILKAIISLSLLVAHTGAAVVTLYGLKATDAIPPSVPSIYVAGTTAYKAINPSPGSPVTTYEVEEIRSQYVVYDPAETTSITLLSTPTTLTYTRVEGLSEARATFDAVSTPAAVQGLLAVGDFYENCKFDREKNKASCDIGVLDPLAPQTKTETVSGTPTTLVVYPMITAAVTGELVPIATVTVAVPNGASRFGLAAGGASAALLSSIPAIIAFIAL